MDKDQRTRLLKAGTKQVNIEPQMDADVKPSSIVLTFFRVFRVFRGDCL